MFGFVRATRSAERGYGNYGASSTSIPVSKTRRPAQRGSSLKGSKKIGCPAFLTVTVLYASPSTATVQLHGLHNHGTGGMATADDLWARMIAPELQRWILQSLPILKDQDEIYKILNVAGYSVPPGTAHA